MKVVSLYARVSSKRQVQEGTIESQVAELERRINEDKQELLNEQKFIDNGYSGSKLERPGLDELRDKVAEGKIDKVYIHSPDRLSRNYVHQMILLEEFQKAGAEVIFLNHQVGNSPESNLLLQMQGAIAEYERAKIMERNRRGRLHAARKGCISVMAVAPYGYRYIKSGTTGEERRFEINEEEARIVKKLFMWIGEERVSINETIRRLKERSVRTQKGREMWNRSTIQQILKNPAYKGQAAFGKTKSNPAKPRIRPQRNAGSQQKRSLTYPSKENWIYIPIPRIVDEALFNAVEEQLAENRERARIQKRKAAYLLQGLIVCQHCRYAYCGVRGGSKKKGGINYYYRCSTIYAFSSSVRGICNSKPVHADVLEMAIWEKVKSILNEPEGMMNEYQQRLEGSRESPLEQDLERQESKLKRGISRLIDSYTNEYINREEFESRITEMKGHLKEVEEEKERMKDQKETQQEFAMIISSIKKFSSGIESEIDQYDWLEKRSVIRKLVKRIEVNVDDITIVFRIKEFVAQSRQNQNMQHCPKVPAKQFGLNIKETSSLVNAFISLGKQPAKAATAINALLSKLQTAEGQSKEFKAALEDMGITAEEMTQRISENGQDALLYFFETLEKVDKQERSQILLNLFGQEYQDDIALLVGSLKNYKDAINNLADEKKFEKSMQKEFDNRAATTANNLRLLRNAIAEVGMNLGSVMLPPLKWISSILREITNPIARFAEKFPVITTGIMSVITALVGLKVLVVSGGYAWNLVRGGMLAFSVILHGVLKPALISLVTYAIPAVITGLSVLKATTLSLATKAFPLLSSAIPVIVTGLRAITLAVVSNPIGALIAVIATGATLIITNWQKVKNFFSSIWEYIKSIIKPIGEMFSWMGSTVGSIFGKFAENSPLKEFEKRESVVTKIKAVHTPINSSILSNGNPLLSNSIMKEISERNKSLIGEKKSTESDNLADFAKSKFENKEQKILNKTQHITNNYHISIKAEPNQDVRSLADEVIKRIREKSRDVMFDTVDYIY